MAVAELNKQALGHSSANDWLLLLSIDVATFYVVLSTYKRTSFELVWRSNFLTCFLPTTAMAPYHPYVNTCGIDEKLFKMVGNSVSYSLKSS